MLKYTKTMNFNGNSSVEVTNDDITQTIIVAYFTASLDADNKLSTNMTVTNQALYDANKSEVRADWGDFLDEVYAAQDASMTE